MTDAIIHLLLFILVMATATFITRALPFLVLHQYSQHPLMHYLGRYLPPMLMVILLVYSFKDEQFLSLDFFPELLGVLVTGVLHLLWRQPLLSILVGTGVYMACVQMDWVGGLLV